MDALQLRNNLQIVYNLADAGNPNEGVVDCSYEIPNKVRVSHWRNERLALNTHFRDILTTSLQRNQTY